MHPNTFQADDGEILHVWRHGDRGPAIILLHGWTVSHLEWTPFLVDLAQRHRVFCWDARAHGGHVSRTGAVATAARMARDLDNMIEAFGLTGACVVGHSMGALTLWQYLRDHGSGKIGSLCFIDQSPKLITDATWNLGIFGDFDAARSARLIAELRGDFVEAVLRFGAYGLNPHARASYEANGRGWQRLRESLRAQPAAPLIACWEDIVALDLRDVVPRIDRPTLLVYGGRSEFYRIETAHWVAERVPGAQLSIFEEGNHWPQMAEPARFVAELSALAAGRP